MPYAYMTDRAKRRAMSVLDFAGKLALVLAIVAGATAWHGDMSSGWTAFMWFAGALLLVISGVCMWVSVSIELSR